MRGALDDHRSAHNLWGKQSKEVQGHPSTRLMRRELNLLKSRVWKVLRYTLHKKAYHIQILYKLEAEDYVARAAMCHDLLHAVDEENLINHVLLSGISYLWRRQQTQLPRSNQMNSSNGNGTLPKSMCGLASWRIKFMALLFPEKTVTRTNYLDTLQLFLEPQDSILASVIYQQDGATPTMQTFWGTT